MKILVCTPIAPGSHQGNDITAQRCVTFFNALGHSAVSILLDDLRDVELEKSDLLITLHATRSRNLIQKCKANFPKIKIGLIVTGTDINRDYPTPVHEQAHQSVVESLRLADFVVWLQPEGLKLLAESLHRLVEAKSHVVFQSAERVKRTKISTGSSDEETFEICVVGHLRYEKDPFRAVYAAKLLPPESKIRIVLIGKSLSEQYESKAVELLRSNSRFEWIRGLPHDEALARIANASLLVLSSRSEGGAIVISEAIMNDVPILATKISSVLGQLGESYPGLFPVEDTIALSKLMMRCESDLTFMNELKLHLRGLQERFSPGSELNAWRAILADFSELGQAEKLL